MSAIVLLLEIIQALVNTTTWVIHHRIPIAVVAIAVSASWISWILTRPANDAPDAEDDGAIAAPGARLSEDEIRAAEAAFDWDALTAAPADPPADTNPA